MQIIESKAESASTPTSAETGTHLRSEDRANGYSETNHTSDATNRDSDLPALDKKTNISNQSLDENDGRCRACVLIDFSGAPAAGKQTSLQDAFARFRDQRKAERRLMKASYLPGTRSQEYRDQLRAKFIEQAKSYMGVPYHRRYREAEQPEAPLYLDCCGLVRQCLKDLKVEFGFVIGRWNQVHCHIT
jgi:hypothetical protein